MTQQNGDGAAGSSGRWWGLRRSLVPALLRRVRVLLGITRLLAWEINLMLGRVPALLRSVQLRLGKECLHGRPRPLRRWCGDC